MPREVPMCQLVLSQVGIVRFVEGFVSNIEITQTKQSQTNCMRK